MASIQVLQSGPVAVLDYRCTATSVDRPYTEVHRQHSISYVRKGTFGCRSRGRSFELVRGSFLVGCAGEEYVCTHEHHDCADECLSFQFTPESVEQIAPRANWRVGCLPPLSDMIVLGEWAQAIVRGESHVGFDELGLLLGARFARTLGDAPIHKLRSSGLDRRRAVDAALWIDAHSSEEIDLASAARVTGLSSYHFLRVFSNVLGVTPHQYLVRSRLRSAARMLLESRAAVTDIALAVGFNDVSNFVRSFRRAAGVSPRTFRRAARGDRNFLQERLATAT